MEVLLKVSAVHDAILNGVGAINEELDRVLLAELLDGLTLALQLLLAGLLDFLGCGSHPGTPLLRDVI